MDATSNYRVKQATQAIVELINSRPRSPRPDEISAIIAEMVVEPASDPPACDCRLLDAEYGPVIQTK